VHGNEEASTFSSITLDIFQKKIKIVVTIYYVILAHQRMKLEIKLTYIIDKR